MEDATLSAQLAGAAALRVMARCDMLAQISETPEELTRVYLSPQHLRANQQVGEWMSALGMRVWQDEVGNLCGRYEGLRSDLPAILLGSHLDTVRNAGRYDGMLGVLTAIEVVHYLHLHSLRLPQAIEIIGFADEEGARFGIALLGSRGITGAWPADWLERRDAEGISVGEALRQAGLDPALIGRAKRTPEAFSAYLELHIEQGPILEAAGLALGVVSAINGARRLNCRFIGEAGHAGTVPMAHRNDALNTAARWITRVNDIVGDYGKDNVATVGELTCLPGAVNVIPGEVRLTLDVRSPDNEMLAALTRALLACARDVAGQYGCLFSAEEFYHIDATPFDKRLQSLLAQSVRQVQDVSPLLPSGAGHDAIALASCWPVGMLFVRCKRGISHHPDESVAVKDVAMAIRAYLEAVLALSEVSDPVGLPS